MARVSIEGLTWDVFGRTCHRCGDKDDYYKVENTGRIVCYDCYIDETYNKLPRQGQLFRKKVTDSPGP